MRCLIIHWVDFVPARRFIYYCIQLLLSSSSSPALPLSQNHFHFTVFDLVFFFVRVPFLSLALFAECVCVCVNWSRSFSTCEERTLSLDRSNAARLATASCCLSRVTTNVIRHEYTLVYIVHMRRCSALAQMMRSRTRTPRRRDEVNEKRNIIHTILSSR